MIELQALKNVFGTHDEWHAYKNEIGRAHV